MPRITEETSKLSEDLKVFTKNENKKEKKTFLVAAYCRVSTNLDCQKTSLENQIDCFTRYIKEHKGWKLGEIYVEKGLSGTSADKRPEFQRMIADAKAGKINCIITKSISRFARNTVDLLNYVRILKECNVNVIFEEQKLATEGLFSEILLTIHGAFAQEESLSISENVKNGKRKRFALGQAPWSALYGYRQGEEKGTWIIQEDEAKWVKRMFDLYEQGKSLPEIARLIKSEGFVGPKGGKPVATTIADILHNEKYIGDVVMQKYYNPSIFAHKTCKNDGSVLPRYYLSNHHPAIVDRQLFEDVQATSLLKDYHRGSHQYPYYGFLVCPYCGEKMVATSLFRNSHGIAWTCGGKESKEILRAKRTNCPPFLVKSKYIDRAVIQGFSELTEEDLKTLGVDERFTPKTIEYSFLRKYVKRITFSKDEYRVDFENILITWKNSKTSKIYVKYDAFSEFPVACPEWIDGQYYADGIPMGPYGAASRNIYVGRLLAMDFCWSIKIFNNPQQLLCPGRPEMGKFEVPIVIAPDSIKQGDKDYGREL